jgi:hypothetical protein
MKDFGQKKKFRTKGFGLIPFIVVMLLILSFSNHGCQKNVGNNDDNDNPPLPDRGLIPSSIVDVKGGSVGIDGLFALYIASGSISDTVRFNITRQSGSIDLPDSFLAVGNSVKVEPSGTRFTPSATVLFRFNPSRLAVNPYTLTIFTKSSSDSLWQALETNTDIERGISYAETGHLSFFALGGKPVPRSGIKAYIKVSRDIFNHAYHVHGWTGPDPDYRRTDVVYSIFEKESLDITAIGGVKAYPVYVGKYHFNSDTMGFDTLSDMYYYPDSFYIELGQPYRFFMERTGTFFDYFDKTANFPNDEPHLDYAGFGDTLLLSGDTSLAHKRSRRTHSYRGL